MNRRRAAFDAAFATMAETSAALRTKKISARELLNITFQRIDRHNPSLNAIVWQCHGQALARAKQADHALGRGKSTGALHGVPVTIKESFASLPGIFASKASAATRISSCTPETSISMSGVRTTTNSWTRPSGLET